MAPCSPCMNWLSCALKISTPSAVSSLSPQLAMGEPSTSRAAAVSCMQRGALVDEPLGVDVGVPVEVGHGVPLRAHRLVVERDELAAGPVVVPQEDAVGVVVDDLDGGVDLALVGQGGCRLGRRHRWSSGAPVVVSWGAGRGRGPAARSATDSSPARRDAAEAADDAGDERLPGLGVGPGQARAAVQQQAEVEDAHEEEHGVGIDLVAHGAVDLRPRPRAARAARRKTRVRLVDGRGHLGLAAGGHVGLEAHRLGVGERVGGVGGDGRDQVGHPGEVVAADAGGAAGVRHDRLAQQVVLRPEPAVDRAGRQARLADDVHDLGAVVALAGEDGGRGPQQALAQLVAAGAPCADGAVGRRRG